ncbi:RagB/SusD family nutrient uptake outer membrane protein [Flavobacterium johnsoniae]|uniref:RagB/SusD family nutrient uptake outer membrane protein n=1 Tax=Flavobacterium johnsoniae TaxID=986 RepID=UPI0025B07C53|nr:RagB/SusD family nutrient uptake outer membrane protein [Flavobacterium johnsoniae]WJS93847.1 RagB/SusD family nutrient uptake outer membrane protein [Flavobacterium johnsoniae]
MKNLKYIYIGLVSAALTVTSCQLTEDLDDYKPPYALEADVAINSESSAELALTGAYAAFRQKSAGGAFPIFYLVPDIMSGYSNNGSSGAAQPEPSGWANNNPIATGAGDTKYIYGGLYDLINRTNWLIEKVTLLDNKVFTTPGRKAEILAEAKILRALGHFYLLRTFGQFYDVNSEYGILVRTAPVKNSEISPRNTVAETYTAIIADLDEGIANAPDLRNKKYTNKTFAKGLKARVLLYKGDYANAAALCKDIIATGGSNFKLEPTYGAIFDDHDSATIFTSSEILFGTAGESNAGLGIGNYYSGFSANISQVYKNAIAGSMTVGSQTITYDTARTSIFITNLQYGGFYTTKYTSYFTSGTNELFYHMRMAEVYLILAEASARANNAVTTDALSAINTIRTRAGAVTTGGNGFETYPNIISLSQFLTAVRFEKLAELYAEGGETWFDLIRYDYADGFGTGFKVSDVKATATNSDKFILPIPTESIDAGNHVIKQNPSY